jgi:hypothetical protein
VPLFMARKEVFAWLNAGTKTIDVRRGVARNGEVAFFQSGVNCLQLSIVKKETGTLKEVITQENFRSIIPTAKNLGDVISYLQGIYGTDQGVFTAYYLSEPKKL